MSDVLTEINAGVAVITLNRPEKRNAFTREMGQLISRAYQEFDADPAVRAIVLTGSGSAFCAGADLDAGSATFAKETRPDFTASPVNPAAFQLHKPVIAAMNGHAIGIGFTLAMQADIRIVADSAKYAVAEVRRGIVPDMMSHWTVPQATGSAAAAEILLTGRYFSGDEAVRLGVASRSVPSEDVLTEAMSIASDIAVNTSPVSVAMSKRLLWTVLQRGLGPTEVADIETDLHHQTMGSADSVEGVMAFLERRDPQWATQVPTDWSRAPWDAFTD